MKGRLWLAAVAVTGAVSLAFHTCPAAEHEDQRQVVRAFLEAYVQRDMPRIRACAPTRPEDLFGAYPFVGLPTLSPPKVDEREALIEFVGVTARDVLPSRGGLYCYQENGTWKVRQVLFYQRVPRIYSLPKRSLTAADRRQEPAVAAVGISFLKAWERGDTAALLDSWYDWTHRKERPIRGLRARDLNLSITPISDQEAFGVYRMTLSYQWGILAYSMDTGGGLFLVKEGDRWKVCGNVMMFSF